MDKIELIDRVAVRALAYISSDWSRRTYSLVVELADIDDLPTIDAVPVVRCKDCVLRGDDKCPMMWWEEIVTDDDGWSEYNYTPHDRTTDDGFCHMARRADDDKID